MGETCHKSMHILYLHAVPDHLFIYLNVRSKTSIYVLYNGLLFTLWYLNKSKSVTTSPSPPMCTRKYTSTLLSNAQQGQGGIICCSPHNSFTRNTIALTHIKGRTPPILCLRVHLELIGLCMTIIWESLECQRNVAAGDGVWAFSFDWGKVYKMCY